MFEQVYGFVYRKELHYATLSKLFERVRSALLEVATLERSEGKVKLSVDRMFAVADPRTRAASAAPIAYAIAQRGALDARGISQALSIPLRTVQKYLKELIEEGVCVTRKSGRRMEYIIEDTTYLDPTWIERDG